MAKNTAKLIITLNFKKERYLQTKNKRTQTITNHIINYIYIVCIYQVGINYAGTNCCHITLTNAQK